MKRSINTVLLGLLIAVADASAEWQPIQPLDTLEYRCGHATAYDPIQDKLYMFGGSVTGYSDEEIDAVQRFDPVFNSWEMLAPMPTPRIYISAARVRDRIYVPGGMHNSSALDVNEAYDIKADTWITCAPLPTATLGYVIGVYRDSLIYVCGGYNLRTELDSVWVYCPTTDAWSSGTRMPRRISTSSSAIIGDTIYILTLASRAVGPSILLRGYIHPDDPTQIDWHQGPEVLEVHGTGPATAVGGKFFFQPDNRDPALWFFDPRTGQVDSTSLPGLPDSLIIPSWTGGDFLVGRNQDRPELYVIAGQIYVGNRMRYLKLDLSAYIGVEETPDTDWQTPSRGPTIIRGVLSLPAAGMTNDQFPMTMLDISGRKVMELTPGDNDVRHLAPGVYFVREHAAGSSRHSAGVRKVVIQR